MLERLVIFTSEGVFLGYFDRHISVRYILSLTKWTRYHVHEQFVLYSCFVFLYATKSVLFKSPAYVFISSSTKIIYTSITSTNNNDHLQTPFPHSAQMKSMPSSQMSFSSLLSPNRNPPQYPLVCCLPYLTWLERFFYVYSSFIKTQITPLLTSKLVHEETLDLLLKVDIRYIVNATPSSITSASWNLQSC